MHLQEGSDPHSLNLLFHQLPEEASSASRHNHHPYGRQTEASRNSCTHGSMHVSTAAVLRRNMPKASLSLSTQFLRLKQNSTASHPRGSNYATCHVIPTYLEKIPGFEIYSHDLRFSIDNKKLTGLPSNFLSNKDLQIQSDDVSKHFWSFVSESAFSCQHSAASGQQLLKHEKGNLVSVTYQHKTWKQPDMLRATHRQVPGQKSTANFCIIGLLSNARSLHCKSSMSPLYPRKHRSFNHLSTEQDACAD